MTNNDRDLLYTAAGVAGGAVLNHYANAYLLRTRGQQACRQFNRKAVLTMLASLAAGAAGFLGLPDLPVPLQNPAALLWMIAVPVLFFGPLIPMAVYARRESRYRKAARGPLPSRIYADLHQHFPRSMP